MKETVEQISTPLAHVFYVSLHEGIVPLEWKEANSIPLFKKGSRNKSVNFRPVSVTPVICKLLETIIRDHMRVFLIKYKLINLSQHGFLKARSCLTNLLRFFEEIKEGTCLFDINNHNRRIYIGENSVGRLPLRHSLCRYRGSHPRVAILKYIM